MTKKVTGPALLAMKSAGQKIVCCTAYDALEGMLSDAAGIDVVLVGDSVANARLGFSSTVAADHPMMMHHVGAVARGVSRALLVGDMPFGSYGGSVGQAFDSATALMRAGAEAVKLEGTYLEEIRTLVKAGIPVMGHLGMTPQSVHVFGGHKVQGRDELSAEKLLADALALEEAGVIAIVLELVPAELSRRVSEALRVPSIGIGAGVDCDGEIQVITDLLGLSEKQYKHAKPYVQGRSVFVDALARYAKEVREREFPTSEQSF